MIGMEFQENRKRSNVQFCKQQKGVGVLLNIKVKVKVPLDNFCPAVFDSRGRCSSPFPSHRASVLSKDNLSVVTWPV